MWRKESFFETGYRITSIEEPSLGLCGLIEGSPHSRYLGFTEQSQAGERKMPKFLRWAVSTHATTMASHGKAFRINHGRRKFPCIMRQILVNQTNDWTKSRVARDLGLPAWHPCNVTVMVFWKISWNKLVVSWGLSFVLFQKDYVCVPKRVQVYLDGTARLMDIMFYPFIRYTDDAHYPCS